MQKGYRSGSNKEGFDGDRVTRSFIPTLIIGSKIDPKIILEEGTVASGEEDVFYAEEQNIILEDTSGVVVTERFLADDRLQLTLSTKHVHLVQLILQLVKQYHKIYLKLQVVILQQLQVELYQWIQVILKL